MKRAFMAAGLSLLALAGCGDEDEKKVEVNTEGALKLEVSALARYELVSHNVVEFQSPSDAETLCILTDGPESGDMTCFINTGTGASFSMKPQVLTQFSLIQEDVVEFIPAADTGLGNERKSKRVDNRATFIARPHRPC